MVRFPLNALRLFHDSPPTHMRTLAATRLPLTSFSSQALQLRLCGTSQGFHFLQSVNLLPVLVKEYMDVGVVQDVLAMGVSSMAMFTIPRVGASGVCCPFGINVSTYLMRFIHRLSQAHLLPRALNRVDPSAFRSH